MTNKLEEQIQNMLAEMDEQNEQEPETGRPGNEATDRMQDIYMLIVREREEEGNQAQVVASTPTPVTSQQDSCLSAYLFVCFSLFLTVSTLAFQLYCLFNPPIATVTIIPKSQTVTMTGTLQLGRALQPLTISQSQTSPTSGTGHQDARAATGTVTFYNGQQTAQTVAAGTVFTGKSGVRIKTTQPATIPPGNPSTGYGTVTVTAKAIEAGRQGNLQAGDVNTPIALAVFVKNNPFTGGQNARDFSTVSPLDINKISTPLQTALAETMQGALQGQLTPSEQLQLLPCTPTVNSDHQIGQEATTVNVTVSETCSAVAYNSQTLTEKVTALLSIQAATKLGTSFSLFGGVQVSVHQATVTHTTTPLVFLSFQARGTWVYALSSPAQQQMKSLIAGKTKQEALQLLSSLPGIEQAAIHWVGFGDATRLPKNRSLIHITLFIV